MVATLLSSTWSNVTRYEVTEGRVATLQVVVAVFLWNIRALLCTCLQCLSIFELLRNPDTTIITQRLWHQCQLRLLVAMYRNTGWVNLNVRWISHVSTLTIALNSGCTVTTHSVGWKEVSVTIATSCYNNCVCSEALQLTSYEVLSNDTTCMTIDDNDILHLITCIELYLTSLNLCA